MFCSWKSGYKDTLPTELFARYIICWAFVYVVVHSSQTQLAMSCNQGRKLTPATEFWWLARSTLPATSPCNRPPFGNVFSICLVTFFRRIQSADGLLDLGSISNGGCRLKKSVSALHVIPYSLHAWDDNGKREKNQSWTGRRKCVVLPNDIVLWIPRKEECNGM